MSAFLDLMRLSAKNGKMINVPDHYIEYCYSIHRQNKGLKSPYVNNGKMFINSGGVIMNAAQYSKKLYSHLGIKG